MELRRYATVLCFPPCQPAHPSLCLFPPLSSLCLLQSTPQSSHLFTLPPLDEKDGFVHLSTAKQLPGTLSRFFGEEDEVVLLKMDYRRLSSWKDVRWEGTSSGEAFPHLYGYGIEGEMVESFKEVRRGDASGGGGGDVEGEGREKQISWEEALRKLEQEGWLVY